MAEKVDLRSGTGMAEATYSCSSVEFFHSTVTKTAIEKLASKKNLVIYCGAGTTIDRTGLGWAALITSIFTGGTSKGYPTDEEIKLMAKTEASPLQLASILTQYSLENFSTDVKMQENLGARLASLLYQNASWAGGLTSEFIAQLAFEVSAGSGGSVTIVTTNYDTFIETRIRELCTGFSSVQPEDVLADGADEIVQTNQRTVSVNAISNDQLEQPLEVNHSADGVQFVYLHGSVDAAGTHRGTLVLSEADYQRTRQYSVELLSLLFSRQQSAVVILGASLTDPPLIEALAVTRKNAEDPGNKISRVCVLPISSTGYVRHGLSPQAMSQMKRHITKRGRLLGVDILIPDFHFQVAQFGYELSLAAAERPYSTSDERYGMRLSRWFTDWEKTNEKHEEFSAKFFAYSQKRLALLRSSYFDYDTDDNGEDESLRLEIWARTGRGTRQLSLIASSLGVLTDKTVRRCEPLSVTSTNASVRAFQEGRPLHVDATDILRSGKADVTSRWKSYLSVPIKNDDVVPVGVVTLASTRTRDSSGLPSGISQRMEQIVDMFRDLGTLFLDNPTDLPGPPI
ncbi:SIR2 family protein [Arthrobacter sp. PsM3]|uniref:SIR2 family protein n=1 Tax=Arthrobacter sp. PsM3 TaxID=3030531 RepID=UPI00263B3E94|nr:SIR2 family protein [Arthrobacter sp. PsM3]MDN4646194.1 SIR2 family protein [Arthrobacter sp. PsM3]